MKKQMLALLLLASSFHKQSHSNWKNVGIITGLTWLATRLYATTSIAIKTKMFPAYSDNIVPGFTLNPSAPIRSGWKVSNMYNIPALVGGGALGMHCLGKNGKPLGKVAWMIPATLGAIGAAECIVGSIMYKRAKHAEMQKQKEENNKLPADQKKSDDTINSFAKQAARPVALGASIRAAEYASLSAVVALGGSLLHHFTRK